MKKQFKYFKLIRNEFYIKEKFHNLFRHFNNPNGKFNIEEVLFIEQIYCDHIFYRIFILLKEKHNLINNYLYLRHKDFNRKKDKPIGRFRIVYKQDNFCNKEKEVICIIGEENFTFIKSEQKFELNKLNADYK